MDEAWIKQRSQAELFSTGSEVVMAFPGQNIPVLLRCQISFAEDHWVGVDLPEAWQGLTELLPGMSVCLSQTIQRGVFSLHGTISEVHLPLSPHIMIEQEGAVAQDQRRRFFRLSVERAWTIARACLPDGSEQQGVPAFLMDVSASGVGFRLETFLAPGTHLTTENIFAGLPEVAPYACELTMVWCRPQRQHGYRGGAVIVYPDSRGQDQMTRFIHELQRRRLAKKNGPGSTHV